jgi:hypothetical protein
MYFGSGDQLILGTTWDPVEEEDNFAFSLHDSGGLGDHLFLYCTWVDSIIDGKPISYNIIAALSTTGTSFESDGLDVYSNEQSALPSNLRELGYGVIILPADAATVGTSYRYSGPIFTKQDLYAKALINKEYWRRTGSSIDVILSDEETPIMTPIGGQDKAVLMNGDGQSSSNSSSNQVAHCMLLLLFLSGIFYRLLW